jgi:hypothetical protein
MSRTRIVFFFIFFLRNYLHGGFVYVHIEGILSPLIFAPAESVVSIRWRGHGE